MFKKNINLNWLRSFEAVARHLSITVASKELGLTQAAVSLQIKSLEGKLGQKLFIRRAKSLILTEIAKAYLPTVRDSLRVLSISTNGLFGPDLKNTIVVRTSMALIVWLSPKLAEFQRQHPNIGIKFITAIWVDSANAQPVDIDIVLVPDRYADKHMEKLSTEYLIPIVNIDFLGKLESEDKSIQLNPIDIAGYEDHWSQYLDLLDTQHNLPPARLQVDTFTAACEFVACGLGCAIVLERFAQNAITMGHSIKYAGQRVPLSQSHYLLESKLTTEINPAAEIFKHWLKAQF